MSAMHSSTDFTPISANRSQSYNDNFIGRHASRFSLAIDSDWTIREAKLHILQMFLDGSIYDGLAPFHSEYQGGGGKYIPLSERRPSTLYKLCEIIVNETVGMLFGDGHFPQVKCNEDHEQTIKFLNYITNTCHLKKTMLNAARVGSIGSVCILIKVLSKKFYFDVLNTKHLTPVFDYQDPCKLIALHDHKKVDGGTLFSLGYEVEEKDIHKYFWLDREWNETEEIYYKPYLVDKEKNKRLINLRGDEIGSQLEREIDAERSSVHSLGFVPAVWIQNIPHAHHIDGYCTFEAIVDTQTEIDYQLSQAGRLLKYNSDPTFVVKNPSAIEGHQLIKSQTYLNLDEKGDAYFAEMSGNGVAAVMDFVKLLRELGLESVRGNRSSPDKMHAAQSGRALQMLNNPLVNLVDEMRLTYGDSGLLCIYKMCIMIYNSGLFDLDCGEYSPESDKCVDHLSLYWQDWYPSTGHDKLQEAQTLQIYRGIGIVSQKTAMNYVAEDFGIENFDDEIKAIDNEKDIEQNRKVEMAKVEPKPEKTSGA